MVSLGYVLHWKLEVNFEIRVTVTALRWLADMRL